MTFINPTAWLDLKILLAFCTFSFLYDPGLAVHFDMITWLGILCNTAH